MTHFAVPLEKGKGECFVKEQRIDLMIVRHGLTKNNAEGRFCGRADYPLTPEGAAQIREMVDRYPYPVPDKVFCSPALRCRQTAQLAFPGQSLELDEDLWELFFGEFEEKSASEVWKKPDFQEGWLKQKAEFSFPGGETIGHCRERGVRALRRILAQAAAAGWKRVGVVTHSLIAGQFLHELLCEIPSGHSALFCPNGMGIDVYAEAAEIENPHPLHYAGSLPVGAPVPDMSDSPYTRRAPQ